MLEKLPNKLNIPGQNDIDGAISKLKDKAAELLAALDRKTDEIRQVEAKLKSFNCLIPFSLKVYESGNLSGHFSWQEHPEHKKQWRIFIEAKKDDETILKKPFIETKVDTRMFYFPYLNQFIRAFTEHLSNKTK